MDLCSNTRRVNCLKTNKTKKRVVEVNTLEDHVVSYLIQCKVTTMPPTEPITIKPL